MSLKNTSNNETCLIYVRLRNLDSNNLCVSLLDAILHCPTVCYSIIRNGPMISLRVRILMHHLHSALTSTDAHLDTVRLWGPNHANPTLCPSGPSTTNRTEDAGVACCPALAHSPSPTTLNLTAWNCRGLCSGEPYIHHLAESGCDIIAVSEHWLWPFEADRLCNIHPAFMAEVKIDERLTENSTLKNDCGGVGLMWRKDMNVTPISLISSDRICGLCVKSPQPGAVDITIIGVYLPCSDMGMECYSEYLIELERIISEHQQHGPMVGNHGGF